MTDEPERELTLREQYEIERERRRAQILRQLFPSIAATETEQDNNKENDEITTEAEALTAEDHPAATELRALNQDKGARDRALLDLLHPPNPQTEETE